MMVRRHMEKIPVRGINTHKGDFGHVFIIAGSRGMTGAAYLASQAALLSGSGLVTCAIPESLNMIMEIKLTEVMTLPLPETKEGTLSSYGEKIIVDFSKKTNSVAIGPGISRNKKTQHLINNLLGRIKCPVVLDADGIMAIVNNRNILGGRKAPTVLTPHPGEMAHLIKKPISYIQDAREEIALSFAKKHKVVIVLKGHNTVVADSKGEVFVNQTGNSGMSTAGSGDVLTGMIASFVGQGISSYSAAVIGVYLHGLAGDIAAKDKGQFSLIAGDMLEKLPQALKDNI
ncbi:MAG: NAD(P)H-hydrate dehydratase [Candidatus Omnitrophota bacterium]